MHCSTLWTCGSVKEFCSTLWERAALQYIEYMQGGGDGEPELQILYTSSNSSSTNEIDTKASAAQQACEKSNIISKSNIKFCSNSKNFKEKNIIKTAMLDNPCWA